MSEQVQVRFVTESQYKVNDAAMLLPSDIKKEGLSAIVNGLLDNETPVPFDFLIDGQLLRTSIAEYLNMNRLSTENLITIEYVESMLPPVPLTAYQHDDWISSVTGNRGLFVTGSYDNMVRLWNTTGECISTLVGHTDSVKSVALGRVDDNKAIVFSGSLDHSVLAWEYSFDDESYRLMYECKGHKGPVESIATDSTGNYIASAAADGIVRVWTSSEPTEDESLEEEPKKKKKKTVNSRKIKTKSLELEGHVGAVNAVTFNTTNSNIVYTGGWDHSIRSWDVEQQVNLVTKVQEKKKKTFVYQILTAICRTVKR
ncbi:WD40 repeat-like protein [Rhizopus microsporus]|uniref:WD40 repeat-like protein n=1 Tax=Rhizopus microsporus TaxID=58291 RepID=A0A1X0SG69_RHIZD|nr:WD40 repeat-like protein [Rhizopus microsporus]